jgi:hypothetical protein
MQLILAVVSGLCWTLVYVEAIRVGLRDKTYAMPVFALGLNLAWEALYAVDGMLRWPGAAAFGRTQTVINAVWLLFDLAIAWTFLRFGRTSWPQLGPAPFAALGASAVIVGFGVQLAFYSEFEPDTAAAYSAFGQNLLMSVLFLGMLLRRGSSSGQSLLIAWGKLLGTLAPTISFGILGGNAYVAIMGGLCLVFDLAYAIALRTSPRPAPPRAGG